ncbi:hypothetical protein B7C42_01644 [Nocardia cerradoensis]|uniref:Phage protein Gp19/Gp15/Gp42 n=1 Tax=Nocardia cerradoensis TaxID=85688 RepID=A0A231HCV1_9NOCA|nr:hypothetical protein [Nocardia cerradoensis]OXR46669.1 hypothetical protein B7C42_01644 [Nocardia cerradoensis]
MTTPDVPTFAQVTDVTSTWRTLSDAQIAYANLLLQAAALWIRNRLPNIESDSPAAKIVSIEVVRAALQRDQLDGVPSGKKTRGSRSDEWTNVRTATIQELAQTLVFSQYHYQLLGIRQPSGPRYGMGSGLRGPDPIRLRGYDGMTGWGWG